MLPQVWAEFLGQTGRELFSAAMERAEKEYEAGPVYPPRQQLLTAFRLVPPEKVRVVILGQDPYHEPGQAHGLAFSVKKGVKLPPSLRNIFTELESDMGIAAPDSGDLTAWAQQGVLLLNAGLTVRAGQAGSHKDLGWHAFTDHVTAAISRLPQPVAFVLWGAHAQKKAAAAALSDHPRLVLQAPHPSPLSAYRGFFGSRPFSKINEFLLENGENAVNWQL